RRPMTTPGRRGVRGDCSKLGRSSRQVSSRNGDLGASICGWPSIAEGDGTGDEGRLRPADEEPAGVEAVRDQLWTVVADQDLVLEVPVPLEDGLEADNHAGSELAHLVRDEHRLLLVPPD